MMNIKKILGSTQGAIGYLLAWLLGVPASILVIIFLLRGG
jgi:hypothetical protein